MRVVCIPEPIGWKLFPPSTASNRHGDLNGGRKVETFGGTGANQGACNFGRNKIHPVHAVRAQTVKLGFDRKAVYRYPGTMDFYRS